MFPEPEALQCTALSLKKKCLQEEDSSIRTTLSVGELQHALQRRQRNPLGLDVLVSGGLERCTLIANNNTKLFNVLCLNCDFWASESFMDVYLGEGSIISMPQLPAELRRSCYSRRRDRGWGQSLVKVCIRSEGIEAQILALLVKSNIDQIRFATIYSASQSLEVGNVMPMQPRSTSSSGRVRGGPIIVHDNLLPQARSKDAAEWIADGRGTPNDCGRCGEPSTSAVQGRQEPRATQKPQEERNQIGRQFFHLLARVWRQLKQKEW